MMKPLCSSMKCAASQTSATEWLAHIVRSICHLVAAAASQQG